MPPAPSPTQTTKATSFDEYDELTAILNFGGDRLDVLSRGEVRSGAQTFQIYTASIGSREPDAPAVGFFAGIHGLERIGSQVVLHYLKALLFRLNGTRC